MVPVRFAAASAGAPIALPLTLVDSVGAPWFETPGSSVAQCDIVSMAVFESALPRAFVARTQKLAGAVIGGVV